MPFGLGRDLIELTLEHLLLVSVSMAIAISLAIPTGILLTRREGLRRWVVGCTNVMQTVPSLALFGFTSVLVIFILCFSFLCFIDCWILFGSTVENGHESFDAIKVIEILAVPGELCVHAKFPFQCSTCRICECFIVPHYAGGRTYPLFPEFRDKDFPFIIDQHDLYYFEKVLFASCLYLGGYSDHTTSLMKPGIFIPFLSVPIYLKLMAG